MKVISFCKNKGGVGSTTSVFNISAILTMMGYKVLMIDLDAQGSLTKMCFLNEERPSFTISDVLFNNESVNCCISETHVKNLHLISSDQRLSKIENEFNGIKNKESKLLKALNSLEEGLYDFVVIDNEPRLGILAINSLVASDYVIIPTTGDTLATESLEDTVNMYRAVKNLNPKLEDIGVLLTCFRFSCKRFMEISDLISQLDLNGGIIGAITWSIEAQKGIEKGIPAVINRPRCCLSKEYWMASERIIREVSK